MSYKVRRILYFVLAFFMVIDFYLIFNAGNPHSFLRIFIKDTSYDVTVTVLFSIVIAVISLMMIRDGDRNSLKAIIEQNADHIRTLKNKNRSNEEIADSFLQEMKAGKLAYFLLKRRVVRYISKIK